ncbi:MAG: ribonuclease E inhibitor RraB [Kineosporiaceae bacterium]
MDAAEQRRQQDLGLDEMLAQYAELGDDGTTPRPVQHAAVFRKRPDEEAAAAVLQERGFSVEVGRRLLKILLTFERTDAITRDRIRAVLDEVVPVIAQHGGEYDGWGSMAQGDAEG